MKSCKSHLLTRGLKPSGTSEGGRSQTAMKNTTIRGEKSWNIPEAVETMARGREHPVVWAGDGAHQGTHIHEPQEGQTAQAGVWQDENSILKKKKTQNHHRKKKKNLQSFEVLLLVLDYPNSLKSILMSWNLAHWFWQCRKSNYVHIHIYIYFSKKRLSLQATHQLKCLKIIS